MARRYAHSKTVDVDPATHIETVRTEPMIVRVVHAVGRKRSVIPAYAVVNDRGDVTHYELRGPGTEGQVVPASDVTVEKE